MDSRTVLSDLRFLKSSTFTSPFGCPFRIASTISGAKAAMVAPKRNAIAADLNSTTAVTQTAKKGRPASGRQVVETAAASRPKRAAAGTNATKKSASKDAKGTATGVAAKSAKSAKSTKAATAKSAERAKSVKAAKFAPTSKAYGTAINGRRGSAVSVEIETKNKEDIDDKPNQDEEDEEGDHSYWLMKAEPESRVEKGKDVKFSIDDLKAATKPEGWDGKPVERSLKHQTVANIVTLIGVRNLAGKNNTCWKRSELTALEARNNMRAMSKGDQAFFYHSNCKIPGIAGIMEIVQESSVDGRPSTIFPPSLLHLTDHQLSVRIRFRCRTSVLRSQIRPRESQVVFGACGIPPQVSKACEAQGTSEVCGEGRCPRESSDVEAKPLECVKGVEERVGFHPRPRRRREGR